MSTTIEIFGAEEEFLTRGISTWADTAPLRVWTVSADGTPVEVTKENK